MVCSTPASLSITNSQNCGSVWWLVLDINLTGLWDAQIFGWTLKTKKLTFPWVWENSPQIAFFFFFPPRLLLNRNICFFFLRLVSDWNTGSFWVPNWLDFRLKLHHQLFWFSGLRIWTGTNPLVLPLSSLPSHPDNLGTFEP